MKFQIARGEGVPQHQMCILLDKVISFRFVLSMAESTIRSISHNDDDDFQTTSSSKPSIRRRQATQQPQTTATISAPTAASGFDPETVFVDLDPTNLNEKVHDESEAQRV